MSGTVFLSTGSSILSLVGHLLVAAALLTLRPRVEDRPPHDSVEHDALSVEPTVV
jgi:hypothetical protein